MASATLLNVTKAEVSPEQIVWFGIENVTAGEGFTVNKAAVLQPKLFVKVIVVLPAETPVTRPVELTVAIVLFDDIQGLEVAAVAEPFNWDLVPIQENKFPVIVGDGLITKELLVVVVPHSLVTFKV